MTDTFAVELNGGMFAGVRAHFLASLYPPQGDRRTP
jgi:hypothetical protein